MSYQNRNEGSHLPATGHTLEQNKYNIKISKLHKLDGGFLDLKQRTYL